MGQKPQAPLDSTRWVPLHDLLRADMEDQVWGEGRRLRKWEWLLSPGTAPAKPVLVTPRRTVGLTTGVQSMPRTAQST